MMRHAQRYVPLAGVLLGLLFLGSSASAASRTSDSRTSDSLYQSRTLTHAGVVHLLAHGQRLRLTSKFASVNGVRLFVEARALNRGGLRTAEPPNWRVYISTGVRVTFEHPGVQTITVHVNRAYRAALLRAGTITEGYYYYGLKFLRKS